MRGIVGYTVERRIIKMQEIDKQKLARENIHLLLDSIKIQQENIQKLRYNKEIIENENEELKRELKRIARSYRVARVLWQPSERIHTLVKLKGKPKKPGNARKFGKIIDNKLASFYHSTKDIPILGNIIRFISYHYDRFFLK